MPLNFFSRARTKSFLLTTLVASAWSSTALAASGGVRGNVLSHSQTTFTDPNANGPPVAGATVSLQYCRSWYLPSLQAGWTCNGWTTRQTTTDADGNYSIWVTDAVNPPQGSGKTMASVGLVSGADEATVGSAYTSFNGTWNTKNFQRAPLMRSPNGAMWLRKYGTGAYPFFFVEGFDPENATKTGDEVIPGNNSTMLASPSILRIMRNSPVGEAGFFPPAGVIPGADYNMLDYLLANDYSVFIVASGGNWHKSQSGSLADHSDGMAYQAMALVKQARQRYAPTQPIVLGGYSLGGSIVRTGLLHWCKGDFAGIAGSSLANGCPEVALWWAADAPLDSATVPESLIRLMKDPSLNQATTAPYKASMNSAAARELLETWTNDGCTTACADTNGCVSANSGFTNGCLVDNRVRTTFQTWNGMPTGRVSTGTHAQLETSMPKRNGTLVPGVAFSMGRAPNFGFLPNLTSPTAVQVNGQTRFMRVNIHGSASLFGIQVTSVNANVDLFAKSETEMRAGSRLNSLATLQTASSSSDSTGWGVWTTNGTISNPAFDFYPTFIPSRSSLLWSGAEANAPTYWKDWRANTIDAGHFTPFPNAETGMVLAWASEYMKGYKSAPVTTLVKKPNLASRAATKEIPLNGLDDDGDDRIDELRVHEGPGLTASWADASNRYVTFVSQNRYWKYDNLEDEFLPNESGYFGEGKYVPNVPMGNANVWFDAPLVNGQKPWDGLGITAAYTAPATGDWNGAATFTVLFSRDKFWIYRGGEEGDQSWMAAGWVGDGVFLAGILPYFEPSVTPSMNGFKPWQLAGITGIHYDEWGRADTLTIYSEDRTWFYRFSDNSWTPGWLSGGVITAAWTTLDRSVQCYVANNPCFWGNCGSTLYSNGGFTGASCYTMGGSWTPRNTFDISGWGSQIKQVEPKILFTSLVGSGCSLGVGTNLAPTCSGKQTCNYPLPAGCGGTISYNCTNFEANWRSTSVPSGGTAVLSCL
jgi:hypothetical protein